MDVHSARESVLDMTAEHVKFCAGNEIAISDEVDLNGTLAFIDYATVQRKVCSVYRIPQFDTASSTPSTSAAATAALGRRFAGPASSTPSTSAAAAALTESLVTRPDRVVVLPDCGGAARGGGGGISRENSGNHLLIERVIAVTQGGGFGGTMGVIAG
ncbi:MAG: hypothetical protein FRX49_11223 [Trebouxia sp. A1-2]|nr:MAG: hypothetical protein FRX49_11223 [Trebouxia sp. A1-2]